MTIVRETGNAIVTQFTTPFRGTWRSVAIHNVPPDAVYDSKNVFIRRGKLRSRPGLSLVNDTNFETNVLGGMLAVTPTGEVVLAVTQDRLYQYNHMINTWTYLVLNDSGDDQFADTDNTVIDFAPIETQGVNTVIIAHEKNYLRQWISSPRSVRTITGTNIPKAKSVCVSASRVVALIPPHTVVWSATLNPANFSAISYAKRGQTGDNGVCVRSLSALSFVLYKERSIHLARAQAGLDESTAFSFQEPINVEGPAGIYAVVDVNGAHIYMTRNGRIAIFDGTSYPRWIADGLWLYLQEDINTSYVKHIRAVYDYRLHTVTFFYPKKGEEGILRGMVILNLPFEGQDIAEPPMPRAFLGVCQKSVTHACSMRSKNDIDRSLIFTSALEPGERPNAFIYDENTPTDAGMLFESSFQTGLVAMPDARHTSVTVESFLERGVGYGSVLIEPVVNDMLENQSGTIPDAAGQWLNLETNTVREYTAFGGQVRFFGLRYTWLSNVYLRYSGAVVYGSGLPKFKA